MANSSIKFKNQFAVNIYGLFYSTNSSIPSQYLQMFDISHHTVHLYLLGYRCNKIASFTFIYQVLPFQRILVCIIAMWLKNCKIDVKSYFNPSQPIKCWNRTSLMGNNRTIWAYWKWVEEEDGKKKYKVGRQLRSNLEHLPNCLDRGGQDTFTKAAVVISTYPNYQHFWNSKKKTISSSFKRQGHLWKGFQLQGDIGLTSGFLLHWNLL